MKIEEKVQVELEKIKADIAEKARVQELKDLQKEEAIATKKATILEWLSIAGVDESAVKWNNQSLLSGDRFYFSVVISDIEIDIRSDAAFFDLETEWTWANPVNDHLFVVGDLSILCRNPQDFRVCID